MLPGDTGAAHDVRQANLSGARVAIALRDGGRATVAQLAERTGLSRPTVEAALPALRGRGIVGMVDEQTLGGRGAGRPARIFEFIADAGFLIGVDVGIHKVRVVIADLAGRIVAWYEREVGHFPLWCVPYRRVHDYEWLDDSFYAGMRDELFLDLAIYGMEQPPGKNIHRMIEEKLRELGGVKTLISHNYYSRDEFWSIWNKRNYDTVKAITDPRNVFRDLYTKTCRAAMGLAE